MIPISNPKSQFSTINHDILSEVQHVLSSGNYILGSNLSSLENEICKKIEVEHCVGVANGTDALVLALEAYGIGKGDEVITTPFSFFATAEAISKVGAKVVFADVNEKTFNLEAFNIEKSITSLTKAIIPVHLFGQPAPMDEINIIAKKYNLIVIEDACQAFGAKYKGKSVGSLGDIACFSFFPTKNLSTIGDGGMVTTSNERIADKIKKLRAHGSSKKYYHEEIGYNSRLDEVHAAILRVCLRHIDEWNERRIRLAKRYDSEFKNLKTIKAPTALEENKHVYHLYCVLSEFRSEIIEFLKQNNIQTGIYYPCCLHLQPAYKDLGYEIGDFPIAESLSERLFAIPLFPYLSIEDQEYVISMLKKFEERIQ